MATLFFSEMHYDPRNPKRVDNDRFVLSKGHAAPVLYAAWAEAGLFPREHLLDLRKMSSDLEGHPTPRLSFADVATGSLGQGICAGIGIALNARRNAAHNPAAVYREPLTLEQYLAARWISTPFCLYDCDVPVDGATAVVVSHVDTVRDRPRPAARIEALGTALHDRPSWDQTSEITRMACVDAAAMLWRRTALRPGDVRVADCDAICNDAGYDYSTGCGYDDTYAGDVCWCDNDRPTDPGPGPGPSDPPPPACYEGWSCSGPISIQR